MIQNLYGLIHDDKGVEILTDYFLIDFVDFLGVHGEINIMHKYEDELSNNSEYHNIIGLYYDIQEKNYDKAIKYYEKSVEMGNIDSLRYLGYYYGEIIKNNEKMVEYYLSAVTKGDIISMRLLGDYYESVELDEKAIEYYTMASNMGCDTSTFNLCILFQRRKDYKKSIKHMRILVDKGYDEHAYEHALECVYWEEDESITIKYLLKCVDLGIINAMRHLGFIYKKNKNNEEAKKYLKMSINNNVGYICADADAMKALANIYLYEKKYNFAIKYFKMAEKICGINNFNENDKKNYIFAKNIKVYNKL